MEWWDKFKRKRGVIQTILSFQYLYLSIFIMSFIGLRTSELWNITLETVFVILVGIYGLYRFNPFSSIKLDEDDKMIGFILAMMLLWMIKYKQIYSIIKANKVHLESRFGYETDEEEPTLLPSIFIGQTQSYNPGWLNQDILNYIKS